MSALGNGLVTVIRLKSFPCLLKLTARTTVASINILEAYQVQARECQESCIGDIVYYMYIEFKSFLYNPFPQNTVT